LINVIGTWLEIYPIGFLLLNNCAGRSPAAPFIQYRNHITVYI